MASNQNSTGCGLNFLGNMMVEKNKNSIIRGPFRLSGDRYIYQPRDVRLLHAGMCQNDWRIKPPGLNFILMRLYAHMDQVDSCGSLLSRFQQIVFVLTTNLPAWLTNIFGHITPSKNQRRCNAMDDFKIE